MRRRVAIALAAIFACSAAGAALALVYIKETTDTLRSLTELHRVEEMRQHLIIAIQAAQSDLYVVDPSHAREVDVVTDNIAQLDAAADRCTGCHHEAAVERRLERIHGLIGEYEAALSYYITASADRARISRLKLDAAALATDLLRTTEEMAFQASQRVEGRTRESMARFDEARGILTLSVVVTFLAAVLVGALLVRSFTRPIGQLVHATRALAGGELGVSIDMRDCTELGELAKHFNSMSAALRDGYAALQAEIEERKHAEARLLYDAFHDALTGLPNRALFLDRLAHLIDAATRQPDQRYAVLFVDLDRFKVINDSLGHLVGDHLLVAVGERIAGSLRPGDTVARLGGDEFGVLLPAVRAPAFALMVAERIQASLGRSVQVEGNEMFVTASIGVAMQSERYTKPEQVLRDADVAMYQAKLKGKACSELFDAQMHGSVVERMQLEADLRRAVEHGEEFELHYQPIVALRTGKLIGVEALIRWAHPARGLLEAAEFVPLADESGTVVPMGEWVFARACQQLREWQSIPALAGITVGVNLSGRQFRRPDLVEGIQRIVGGSGIDPRQLALEVSESVVMDDVEASATTLSRLREIGIQIHVDDFGTGYSSLSYLHRFPITAVKIDGSFVAGLPSHRESEDVVKAIVSIGESLDFDVVAEGVEHGAQAAKLEELRCRYAQGYLISRPMDAAALEGWVRTGSRSVA